MRRQIKCLLCFLLLLTLLPVPPALAQAPGEKVVRVGWYESSFHRTDQFGRRSGYGYEYQQRIAAYTGWTYEYVEGSWPELLEMLLAGEIDLLSDVSYTPERAEKILYSAEAMCSEDFHAFIAADNTEINPDDLSTFNGRRFGVNRNSVQKQIFIDWAASHDVHPELVELAAPVSELLDMLSRGEIDALVTPDTYGGQDDVVPVCKIGAAEAFFGINGDRPDLKRELDAAMNRLMEDNHKFNQQLSEKYNDDRAVSAFLSTDERNWIAGHGVIRVGYRDRFLPFCAEDADTRELTGALSDFLQFAETCEKNATLSFEARAFDTTSDALQALAKGEIDCLFPISLSAYDGERLGVITTDPLINTEMFAAVRTADHQGISPEQELNVATLRGNPSYETFLMDYFPHWKARYYADTETCFQAVFLGEVDCLLVSNYRLNRVSQLCDQYKLSTLSTGEAMDFSFAVERNNDCLYSILNKISRLMPGSTLNSSLTNYAFAGEQVTLLDFIADNTLPAILGFAAIIAVILLLVFRSLRTTVRANEGRRLISEAERDHLTNLYNRSFFFAYANRYSREHPDKPMDAIVLNIERFHTINSLNGRAFGDEVLRTLGAEIDAFLTGADGIGGRLEGDHFDIYCAHMEDYQGLLDRFQTRMNEMGSNADIRIRMGVMPWQPGIQPETMFDLARSACSMVRGKYKAPLMVYDEELRQRDQLDQRLSGDLVRALEEHELEVYYQPKYAIQNGEPRLNSAEALVRWQHPELGMIPPARFVPLFERNGQISAVDNYVWAETARQIAAWREQYGVTLPVSVNLSRVDVFDANLNATLDSLTGQYGLERSTFKLEITESAYTENADQLIRVVGQLRDKGYEIEMDDFGSGYSSLNMLSSMPVDVLKMDMKFVRNIEHSETDRRLVKLILDIAKNLKLYVVAEGVETEGQLTLLKEAGCDLVQGYYFSCPLKAEEFEQKILGAAVRD